MGRYGVADRWLRSEERNDRGQILVADVVIFHEREGSPTIRANPVTQNLRELRVGPPANPGFGIWREVGRVELAKRQTKNMVTRKWQLGTRIERRPLFLGNVSVRACRWAIDQVRPCSMMAGSDEASIGG